MGLAAWEVMKGAMQGDRGNLVGEEVKSAAEVRETLLTLLHSSFPLSTGCSSCGLVHAAHAALPGGLSALEPVYTCVLWKKKPCLATHCE